VRIFGSWVGVVMTLTMHGCPMHEDLVPAVEVALPALPGVAEVDVALVWNPPWSIAWLSLAAAAALGLQRLTMKTRAARRRVLGPAAAGVTGLTVLTGCGAAATMSRTSAAPAIQVRLSSLMAQQSVSKAREPRVPYVPGITLAAVAQAEGFQASDLGAMMVAVSGVQAGWAAPRHPGDRLELMTGMAGG